jgi:DNA-binding MarR family transcriptional regulator
VARSAARSDSRPGSRSDAGQRTGRRSSLAAVPGAAGREALALDPLIHDRTRLGLLSALAVTDVLTFVELRELLNTTDGNLSVHARKLEDVGFVLCAKSFAGRVPRTEYRITPAGRKGLESYLRHMEALIQATQR